jgi:hypothetical protein
VAERSDQTKKQARLLAQALCLGWERIPYPYPYPELSKNSN